jgi:Spy/CpxP family protein refolding chaperone
MKRVSSCLILSFLILFISSQLSYAEPKGPINKIETGFQDESPCSMIPPMMPCDMGQMKGMPELKHSPWMHFQSLNLDKKQKEALREIENSVAKELIRKRADEQIAEIELRELLDKNTVDLNAVETKLKQIATIETESQLILIKSIEKIKVKLTPEQREMLKKIRPMDHWMGPPMKGEMMRGETERPPSFAE